MNLVIDTNRYRDFCEGNQNVVEQLAFADEIHVPFVTLGELRSGFVQGSRSLMNEKALVEFLNRPRTRVLCADEATTHHYARVYVQLRAQGTPIPTNDMWIAALSIQHNLMLYSRDAHFSHLPQLSRLRGDG